MSGLPAVDRGLLGLAVRLVCQAGRITVERFHAAGQRAEWKVDGTIVTEADRAIEAMMCAELARHAPGDGIVGEEHGTRRGVSGRQWVIDPIDGTRFFTHNIPVCTNLLAYEDEHGAAIGVIGMPLQREIVFAGRGLGCWLLRGLDSDMSSAPRVTVGDATVLGDAVIHGTHLHSWTPEFLVALHSRSLLIGNRGDDAYGIAMLVTGRADAVVSVHTGKRWDWAPVPVIVAEAGGVATDLTGAALPGDGSSVATNVALHPRVLDAVASVRRIRPWRRLAEGGARAAADAPPK